MTYVQDKHINDRQTIKKGTRTEKNTPYDGNKDQVDQPDSYFDYS